MTGLRSTLGRLFGGAAIEVEDAPSADLTVAPDSPDQIARLFDFASEHGLVVLPWGAGLHQGFGGRVQPDVVVSTSRLDAIVEWNPDDLTVVAQAGVSLEALSKTLGPRRQSAVLPESISAATVGGTVAAGASGWRRLRYGPTRDRVLQVEFVTGDGRIAKGGARVVKNVTGYDLPRLFTGSFGSLGLITSVCFKLWPNPEVMVTVRTADPERSAAIAHRPYAILETPDGVAVYLGGTAAEVEAEAADLGGEVVAGFDWPAAPEGDCLIRIRVNPSDLGAAVSRLGEHRFIAAHGVGEIAAACDPDQVVAHRAWAESRAGFVVVEAAPDALYESIDPWGIAPTSLTVQRRIKAAFDPAGVMVPGHLPGGI